MPDQPTPEASADKVICSEVAEDCECMQKHAKPHDPSPLCGKYCSKVGGFPACTVVTEKVVDHGK